ncbi:tetratricopeptide repeat protein, partial [bacterium]|nr:tetratricopeptide repeat protein [bacterium]
VYSKQGQFDLAIYAYKQAIALDPNFVDAYNGLGQILARNRKFDEAIDAYKKALALLPIDSIHSQRRLASAHYGLGQVYASQKHYDEAIAEFQQAIENDPYYSDAHYSLANAYTRQGRAEDAAKEMKIFQKLRGNEPLMVKAEQWAKRHPNDPESFNNLGATYAILGRFDQAVEAYKKALLLNPQLATAYYNLGVAYSKIDKFKESVEAYKASIRLNPNLAIAYNNLAWLYTKRSGALDDAVKLAQKAVELEQNPDYMDTLAWIYYKQEMYAKAEETIKQAIQLKPEEQLYQERLDEIRQAMNKP